MTSDAALLPAQRVRGPAALSGDARRFLYLATTLAFTDWKLRFFGSVLGYLWSLLRPLMFFGVLYVVFSHIVRVSEGVPHYPVMLLLGVVLFSYFAEVTSTAVSSVVDRETLVRKIAFPRMVIPVATALTASLSLLLNLVAVAVFVVASGVDPRWTWLLLPIPLVLLMVVATGMAMLVSALYVPFRDVRPIWEVLLQALFYVTPVFWPIQLLIGKNLDLAHVAMGNPLAAIVQSARYLVVGPAAISPWDAIGGAAALAIPIALALAIAAIGFFVFDRMAPHVAERL